MNSENMNFVDVPKLLTPHEGAILHFTPETLVQDEVKHLVRFHAATALDKTPCPGWEFFAIFYKCSCCDHLAAAEIFGCNYDDYEGDNTSHRKMALFLKKAFRESEELALEKAQ